MKKNKYRKYIIRSILVLLIVPVFLLVGIFVLPAVYDDTYMGELKYKRNLLSNTKGNKIVLVGGSSLAFGIDSALMEENFPEYSVVNFGMYAGLGSTVMLDLSIDEIREGDIVIISCEQDAQTLSDYFNATYMWQGADGAVSMLLDLDRSKLDSCIGAAPSFALEKWKYFLNGEKAEGSGVYKKSSFNVYGDVENSDVVENIMPGGWDENQPISFDESLLDSEWIEAVNSYTDEAEKRGAKVYYSFSPMNASAVTSGEMEKIESFYLALANQLQCTVMGNPNDRILDAEWFYDTNFHLNSTGKVVNTRQWIKDLKAVLGDASKTDIKLPDKPALAAAMEYEGDDSDRIYFIREINEDGTVALTGLTDEGKNRKTLTVPTHTEEGYVTSVSADCFKENDRIETLRIQKNISLLTDQMFLGCSSLKEVVLVDITPSDLLVGRELLDGCDANITVEKDYISDFKTDYSWSLYSDRIQ